MVYSLKKSVIQAGSSMEIKYGVWVIIGMCALILLLGGVKKKSECILNFMVRMVVGLVCVYCFNEFLEIQGISVRSIRKFGNRRFFLIIWNLILSLLSVIF